MSETVPLTERATLSPAEAAALTGLSRDTIARAYKSTKADALRAKRRGSRVVIRRVDLDAWLAGLEDY